jgi:sorting nexin-8
VEGETSSLECAHQLGRLCQHRHLVVNLIPYNATDVKDKLQCPSKAHTQKFRDIVASYGTFCTIRRTMGADIASACGQLVQKKQEEENSSNADDDVVVDIEDVVRGGARKGSDVEDVVVRGAALRKGSDQGSTMHYVPSENFEPTSSFISWLGSIPSETLDQWAGVLGASAAVSASCFLASAVVFFVRRK